MIRDDMSNRLVHLTRGKVREEHADRQRTATSRFLSIVRERRLRGGTGYIKGGYRCVCFTEAPISKLANALTEAAGHPAPYAPLGVMISKTNCFRSGGRPVIYQPDSEFELLGEAQRFRHKRYEPPQIDFTWEREWRVHGDYVLDPDRVTLVVPSRAWCDRFDAWYALERERPTPRSGEPPSLRPAPASFEAERCPWHFVVLEDLGIETHFHHVPDRDEIALALSAAA